MSESKKQEIAGQPADHKIRIKQPTYNLLRDLAEQYKLTHDNLILQLVEFYMLKNLPMLLKRIRRKYELGLTPLERSYYSNLYTLLAEIDKAIGL